jgi:hypothetical protein
MLKSFKILCSRTNNIRSGIQINSNNLLKITNNFKFSSSHKHEDHHEENHEDHHHGEPEDYHNLKFDRISYNQKLTKEQRKPYLFFNCIII